MRSHTIPHVAEIIHPESDVKMIEAEIVRKRDDFIAVNGPWKHHRIHLGHGIYTTDKPSYGSSATRILRTVQDFSVKRMSEVSVLDLGAGEGFFSFELAKLGCKATCVEARDSNIAKIAFVKDILGLDNVAVIQRDVRDLSINLFSGPFDIVLLNGIIEALEFADTVKLLKFAHVISRDFVVITTWTSPIPEHCFVSGNDNYFGHVSRMHKRGTRMKEMLAASGSSIGNETSAILTTTSLCALLADSGFGIVAELVYPWRKQFKNTRGVKVFVAKHTRGGVDKTMQKELAGFRPPEKVRRARVAAMGVRRLLFRTLRRLKAR